MHIEKCMKTNKKSGLKVNAKVLPISVHTYTETFSYVIYQMSREKYYFRIFAEISQSAKPLSNAI